MRSVALDNIPVLPGDLRHAIFRGMEERLFRAEVVVTQEAVVAGLADAAQEASSLGLEVQVRVQEGAGVGAGQVLLSLAGPALALAVAEDRVLGWVGKASGVATAARLFRRSLPERLRVVCGGWKKLPPPWRPGLRRAAEVGGVATRILDVPFIYLDKNYLRIFGGLSKALRAVADLPGEKVVQLRGEWGSITAEAKDAVNAGAAVLMVDTGRAEDVVEVADCLRELGWRQKVRLAFAGGITAGDLAVIANLDVDIIDVGRAVLDAPLVDLRFEVRGPL